MKKIVLITFCSSIILSAQIRVKKPELVFDQLIGTWQFDSKMEYESWTKKDHIYYANVYSISNGDTTISEKLRIYKEQGSYFFEQRVVLQGISNNSKYRLTNLEEKLMIFENNELEFPQKIGYEWLQNNLLAIVQEGMVQGKLEFIDFSYKKVE